MLHNQTRVIMRLHTGRNDFFYALLMTAVLAFTLGAALIGTLDVARGRAGTEVAKAQVTHVALRQDAGAGVAR
jgi:hypothetical protein